MSRPCMFENSKEHLNFQESRVRLHHAWEWYSPWYDFFKPFKKSDLRILPRRLWEGLYDMRALQWGDKQTIWTQE